MSDKIDETLSIIDRALGNTEPTLSKPITMWCWRCQVRKAREPGLMCTPCHDYMSGNSDEDPMEIEVDRPETESTPNGARFQWRWFW